MRLVHVSIMTQCRQMEWHECFFFSFGKCQFSQMSRGISECCGIYFASGVARIEKKGLCNILYPNQSDSSD